jgi:hypothetical protein
MEEYDALTLGLGLVINCLETDAESRYKIDASILLWGHVIDFLGTGSESTLSIFDTPCILETGHLRLHEN